MNALCYKYCIGNIDGKFNYLYGRNYFKNRHKVICLTYQTFIINMHCFLCCAYSPNNNNNKEKKT